MVLQDRCIIFWNKQNNDTFQCMFMLLKTWIRVGVEHVLVERFGVQVLIDEI